MWSIRHLNNLFRICIISSHTFLAASSAAGCLHKLPGAGTIQPMTFLAPYSAILPRNEQGLALSFVLQDEPGIPDDTYQVVEWYCPNPECDCQEAILEVRAVQQKIIAAGVKLRLGYLFSPVLEPTDLSTPYAGLLVKILEDYLTEKPSYPLTLRDHYRLIKSVAADPSRPAYSVLNHWAQTGTPPESSRKHHRKQP